VLATWHHVMSMRSLVTRKGEDATAAATAAAAQLPLDAPRRLRHKLAYDACDWTFVRQAQ